ncbi:MAG: GMC family oxidoreductase N-terminal domain-containing protein, partial [Chloroflexi bacterium]|nr:GMC family oxidoreductase N-terminal domain-containing protein [Chloroflexota bacterium]
MSYDVIVVGAGSAGAIVAARLSEDRDRSVLLLEAGPDYPTFAEIPVEIKNGLATGADLAVGTDHDWQFTGRATDSQPEMPVPRGKITGGTSAINGQVFLRGAPEDFDTWASWGNDEWSFEKVLPYFRKLEDDRDFSGDWHGQGGPIPVRRHPRENLLPDQLAFYDACLGAGFPDCEDHNRPDSVGVGPLPLNDVDGLRWSTNLGYRNPARHRLNLTIRGEARAHRVHLEGDRAVGVVAESG